LHYSRRIKPWISVDEVDHVFKLCRAKLGRNLINATVVEQQDSRDRAFAGAFSGRPAHILRVEIETEMIRAGRKPNVPLPDTPLRGSSAS
jgi:hypothetical protein